MKTTCSILLICLILFASPGYSQTAEEYYNYAWEKYKIKDYSGAISDFTKAIELDPNKASYHYLRGASKSNLEDFSGAISDFSKSIEIDPIDAGAFYFRGNAKSHIKDYRGAISDFTKAIELDPKDADYNYLRGNAKSHIKDNRGAISDYTKAIELGPNEGSYYGNRGFAKGNLKDYTGAFADYYKALEIDPKDSVVYYDRGLLKITALGQQESGCLDLNKAGELGYVKAFAAIKQYCQKLSKVLPSHNDNFTAKSDTIPTWENSVVEKVDKSKLREFTDFVPPEVFVNEWLSSPPERKFKLIYNLILAKNHEFNDHGFDSFVNDIKDENNLRALYGSLDKRYPELKAMGYDSFKRGMFPNGGNEILIQPKEKIQKKQVAAVDSTNLHFQIDKIKVGGTFIALPIPNGFIKVDETMGVLLESAKKLCPNTNTLLAYYISEEDYANFLVNQDHLVQKYILVEVYNNFKNINVGNKDYRQFIRSFKEKHVEEFKRLSDEAGQIASENLSNINENVKVQDFKMQLFGICYESNNSISYGAISKYNVTVDNEISKDYIVAGISTITKIENKPIFLMLNKSYSKNEDITTLKTINSEWIKEIDKRQSPVSFLANIDFKDYKETILAILTLSIIWAIFIATKKIHRNIVIKKVSKNIEKEEINDFVDFDELLVEETLPIEPICIEPEKIQNHFLIFNPDLIKASRRLRLFNALIDITFLYLTSYCIGLYMGGNAYFAHFVIEYPYLVGPILLFIVYFSQELIFGKTLGKHITGTRVVNNLGIKPTVWQLVIRTASRLIPFEAFTFLSNDKRGFHDTFSNTYVIKD
ncbi:MAG: tetratricopeptide repeat protein [Mariniphaga sp.]|nr:tetratricopeptide repeat protein [Mariniphaga sp.]